MLGIGPGKVVVYSARVAGYFGKVTRYSDKVAGTWEDVPYFQVNLVKIFFIGNVGESFTKKRSFSVTYLNIL